MKLSRGNGMTGAEKHFIFMCGMAGLIYGAQFDDKGSAEAVKSKYSDPVYRAGYKALLVDAERSQEVSNG